MRNSKGFTLIELIMVTIILGIMAAVAIPRYMGTVNKAEEAAERAVINALESAIEAYANEQFVEHGRYRYPENPFDLVDVDGYVGFTDQDNLNDGDWSFEPIEDGDGSGYGDGYIQHRRRDNTVMGWDYCYHDMEDHDSDDRGLGIFEGPHEDTNQGDLSNND